MYNISPLIPWRLQLARKTCSVSLTSSVAAMSFDASEQQFALEFLVGLGEDPQERGHLGVAGVCADETTDTKAMERAGHELERLVWQDKGERGRVRKLKLSRGCRLVTTPSHFHFIDKLWLRLQTKRDVVVVAPLAQKLREGLSS